MEMLVASGIGALTATGVYLFLRLRAFPVILGIALLSYAVNVFLFASGRLATGLPPVLNKYADVAYSDPLPQALALTAIVISFGMTATLVMIALGSFLESADDSVNIDINRPDMEDDESEPDTQVGGARFGIALVLDRLSALMVLLTAVLGLLVLIHVIATGWDEKGQHFHALYQFQLMGIFGAFLTADAFNLFVFFEVLLLASYGLMLHGGGARRIKAGLQYVIMNLAGSTLFLFALGTLYATTGTLNIADLAIKVRETPVEDAALVRIAAMLLLIVFAIKAAIFPVQFWLTETYSNAPAPVAALFAIMTKVGAYSILRMYTISFGPDVEATGSMPGDWLFWGAVVTTAVGAIGVIGARRLMPMLSFAVIGSMGTLMLAVSAMTPEAAVAAMYYLLHSTFAAAALFLLADLVVTRRREGDVLRAFGPTVQNGLFAALFFGAGIGMAGMPPLSGFLGKLMVLDTVRAVPYWPWAWTVILIGSLLTIVGFARAGSSLFWKPTAYQGDAPLPDETMDKPAGALALAPTMAMIAILGLLSAFAYPVSAFLEATAAQLFEPSAYLAIIGEVQTGTGG